MRGPRPRGILKGLQEGSTSEAAAAGGDAASPTRREVLLGPVLRCFWLDNGRALIKLFVAASSCFALGLVLFSASVTLERLTLETRLALTASGLITLALTAAWGVRRVRGLLEVEPWLVATTTHLAFLDEAQPKLIEWSAIEAIRATPSDRVFVALHEGESFAFPSRELGIPAKELAKQLDRWRLKANFGLLKPGG